MKCVSVLIGFGNLSNILFHWALRWQGYDPSKLVQKVVNMDNLPDEAALAFENAHSVFCTLGTTRKVGHIKAVANSEQLCNPELLQGMMHKSLCPPNYLNCFSTT